VSTALLSSRYYKSAAFGRANCPLVESVVHCEANHSGYLERPFHFSILVLLIASVALYTWSWVVLRQSLQYEPLNAQNAHHVKQSSHGGSRHVAGAVWSLLRLSTSPLLSTILCIVVRTLIFWRTIRTIHCSWDGLQVRKQATSAVLQADEIDNWRQSFLPLAIYIYESLERGAVLLPRNGHDASCSRGARGRLLLVAVGWGIATTDVMFLTERTTGAICSPGLPERMMPLAQLASVFCDAYIITHIARLRRNYEDRNGTWRALSTLFLAPAAALTFMALCSSFSRANFRWNLLLDTVTVEDLLFDSITASSALIAAIYLLGTVYPTTIVLTVTAVNTFTHIQLKTLDGTLIHVWSNPWALAAGLAICLGTGYLFQYSKPSSSFATSVSDSPFYRNRLGACSLLIFFLLLAQTKLNPPSDPRPDVISQLIAKSRDESDKWIAAAGQSKTLSEAVSEYSRRHRVPPPPNFDKWYEYAVSVGSPIIDDFGQIYSDLLPYWGLSPSLVRERTTHLLEHPSLSFGGLIITDGRVEISPHIRGTHRWMMEVMQTMIEPFAQWLPDMQLPFNLDDECRVSVPFNLLDAHRKDGLESQARLASHTRLQGFSPEQNPPWPKDYLGEDSDQGEELWKKTSPWFPNWSKSPIFYEWISSTCPASSAVHTLHWWNRKAACPSCAAPHMSDGIISNWTLSGDLCHQPDLAYLHGFLASPSALAPTHTLFPVFSQSRMQNFADVLYPNPWNFGDKVALEDSKGMPWHQKLNSVFWRGASSDGFATHGSWQTFVRARFVYMAQHLDSLSPSSGVNYLSYKQYGNSNRDQSPGGDGIRADIAVNVSFVGNFNRCDERDCTAEHITYYGSSTANPPSSLDFQEHWRHRHLIDLDGAAFSGRFLPFVKSASLPYRAALFRTWWEERVHAWRHFVPIDVRLTDVWSLVSYFGGPGDEEAQRIASEGSEWAKKALRKEDMRVYMFRLLLEWGRIVDDRREELGFVSR
jgi:hypothetical protein